MKEVRKKMSNESANEGRGRSGGKVYGVEAQRGGGEKGIKLGEVLQGRGGIAKRNRL